VSNTPAVTNVPAVPGVPGVFDETHLQHPGHLAEHLRHPAEHLRNPRHPRHLNKRFAYSPQLDGLRAVAVLAVAWSHWERPFQFGIPFGAGVHLFYVLSGFLITRILLDLRAETDPMAALRAFYIRRALRIFPAFYLTLALAWLADVPPVRETLAWHAAYLSNVLIFATETWPGSISHFWSLAVEEQFYVAWPWLIVFAPRRWLKPAVIAAVVSAPLFRWWLANEGYRETLLAVLTPGCLDSLGVGALLALGALTPATSSRNAGTAIVLAAFGWTALVWSENLAGTLPLGLVAIKQTLQALVFGWLVFRAATGFAGRAGRMLSARPVVYIGRISYGIYLAHGFAGEILASVGVSSRAIPEPWRFVILASLTVGVAAVSWHLLEQPMNQLKRRFPYAPNSQKPTANSQKPQEPKPNATVPVVAHSVIVGGAGMESGGGSR
jgi:peptidoglycan/LPS O-acetylase OafA/YrhL